MRRAAAALLLLTALAGCHGTPDPDVGRPPEARGFPRADRPVSPVVSSAFSTEDQRDKVNEAKTVMDLAAIREGTTVADIGAGEGYYTVRLAGRVGKKGRVLAEDIDRAVVERLGSRVERDRLDNVSIRLGTPEDPKLPAGSFDRIFLIHMYHEVAEPYAFLWHLRPALRPNGRVIVVDLDRPTDRHGIPPTLLFCEFAAVGFRLAEFVRKPQLTGYYAAFEAVGDRPAPSAIRPCRAPGRANAAQAG
ncbi:MAG: class I SAM-dependent methyltransferase [Novosphingobium sp.]|nr:class I SAM-dependent methyltransferase [Novosphingobium sp.]